MQQLLDIGPGIGTLLQVQIYSTVNIILEIICKLLFT